MQNINPDQHLGKTGLYYRKKTTNEIIYNATEKLTIKLMNWVRDKFIESEEHEDNLPKTYLPDDVIKEIKEYLVLNFTSTITDLLKKDFPELFQTDTQVSSVKNQVKKPHREEFKESQMSEVLNVSVYKPSQFPTEEYRRNFYLMLNLHLESVFMAPFFILTLASKWQEQSNSIKLKTIKEMQNEIKRLIRYENIVERPTDDREKFVRDILVAIDELKQKQTAGKRRKKITIKAIAEQMEYKGRASFYDDCAKHRIEFDDDLNIIDRKTKEIFVFCQK